MTNINDLDNALENSLYGFANTMQSKVNKYKDRQLNEYDIDDISRQVFYLIDDFRKNIIQYLEDNEQ